MIDLNSTKPLNKGQLFSKMRESLYPVWVLYEIQGFDKYTRRKYDCPIEGTDEQRTEKSIETLQRELANYNPNTFFAIDLKKTVKSGSDGVYENIVFTNMDTQQPQVNGLSGIPNNNFDSSKYVPIEHVNQMMALVDEKIKLAADRAVIEAERKEIQRQKEKYESGVSKLGDALSSYAVPMLKGLFMGGGSSTAPALSGTVQETTNNNDFAVVPENENDERETKACEIATKIYDSKLTLEQLNNFLNNIDKQINPIQNATNSKETE